VQILAFRPPAADDNDSPDKLLASTPGSCRSSFESSSSLITGFDRSGTAAQQPPKAAADVQLPWNARRIVWDRQVQLRVVWLTVFLCVLGKRRQPPVLHSIKVYIWRAPSLAACRGVHTVSLVMVNKAEAVSWWEGAGLRSLLLGLALPAVQPRPEAGAVRPVAAGRQGVRQCHEDRHLARADPAAVLRLHHTPQVRASWYRVWIPAHIVTHMLKTLQAGNLSTCSRHLPAQTVKHRWARCRSTWLDRIVPFDYAVPFHMLVAGTGGLLAIVHTLCHIADYAHAVSQHGDMHNTPNLHHAVDHVDWPFCDVQPS
jgi:hypothetical protein